MPETRTGRERKTRDRAAVLPIMGILLIMPPVAGIFEVEATVLGLPVALVYLFVVWAGLIALARHLSARLAEQSHRQTAGHGDAWTAAPPGRR